MKKILMIAVLIGTMLSSYAQNAQKIGYVDVDYILNELPEAKQVESDLKVHETQLQNQLQAKMQQYQKLLADYQQNAANMTDVIRKDREKEITQTQQNIQEFQQDAQLSLQKKSADLLQPLYDKIGKAIQDVATESGYAYILSSRIGAIDVILYARDEDDVSDLVLKKMGITPRASTN